MIRPSSSHADEFISTEVDSTCLYVYIYIYMYFNIAIAEFRWGGASGFERGAARWSPPPPPPPPPPPLPPPPPPVPPRPPGPGPQKQSSRGHSWECRQEAPHGHTFRGPCQLILSLVCIIASSFSYRFAPWIPRPRRPNCCCSPPCSSSSSCAVSRGPRSVEFTEYGRLWPAKDFVSLLFVFVFLERHPFQKKS